MKKDRLYAYALSAVLFIGIGAAVIECSGGDPCGNGIKDDGEDCDHGLTNGAAGDTCSAACKAIAGPAHASIQISYTRVKVDVGDSYPNYPSPTCKELGVDKAHFVLTGPTAIDMMVSCSSPSMVFDPVMPGTYQAAVTLLDASGAPVTKTVLSTMVDVQVGNKTPISVAFMTEDYLKSYGGNFDFLASWGAANKQCGDVTPAVNVEMIKMIRQGESTPLAGMTTTNHKLDGNPGPCFTTTASMQYEEVLNLQWGYYDLYLTGQAGGATAYCKKFKIFVGPGVANPTYALVVDNVNGFDGGASACP